MFRCCSSFFQQTKNKVVLGTGIAFVGAGTVAGWIMRNAPYCEQVSDYLYDHAAYWNCTASESYCSKVFSLSCNYTPNADLLLNAAKDCISLSWEPVKWGAIIGAGIGGTIALLSYTCFSASFRDNFKEKIADCFAKSEERLPLTGGRPPRPRTVTSSIRISSASHPVHSNPAHNSGTSAFSYSRTPASTNFRDITVELPRNSTR